MSILLVSLRTDRPGHVPGEVVDCFPDGWTGGEDERRLSLIVSCPALGLAAARSTYLRTGVPQNLLDAAEAARVARVAAGSALLAAIAAAKEAQVADIDAAVATERAVLVSATATEKEAAAAANPRLHPHRAVILDVTQIPLTTRNRIRDAWLRVHARHDDMKAAAHAKVRDWLDQHPKFGPLSAEEKLRTPREWRAMFQRRWERVVNAGETDPLFQSLDRIMDKIDSLQIKAEREILSAEYAALPAPNVLTVTLAQLQNATVPNA